VGDTLQWNWPVLAPGKTLKLTFQVTVTGGKEIINGSYAVLCDEGVFAYGEPVITPVLFSVNRVHLPLTFRN
jgi:hypothetical protein